MSVQILDNLRKQWQGLCLAVIIGIIAYVLKILHISPLKNLIFPICCEPLLVALLIGIGVRTILGERKELTPGFAAAPQFFIPVGVVFYAVVNLNFVQVTKIDPRMILLLIVIILVYFGTILLFGHLLRQKQSITYLTATGSAICGASAIAITTPVVEADPDDVSISLLSVTLAALVGLFIILPFCGAFFSISNKTYGLLSGSILQFTGFVEAAVRHIPFLRSEIPFNEVYSLALSVKAARYLGLLIAIPLFASLGKKKICVPLVLWVFTVSGIIGTVISVRYASFFVQKLMPAIYPIFVISWSIAMASIGLNADIKQLLSKNGTKALIMAFSGFIVAMVTFFLGYYFIK